MILLKYKVQILLFAFAISLIGCATDEETVIIPKTLEQYHQEMSAFVASEKSLVENCVVGYNKRDFKSSTNFDTYPAAYLTVLVAAEVVLARPEVTIADIINANKTLAVPGKNFTGSLWISDRRPLHEAIVEAEALNTATEAGSETGQVSEEAKTTFTAAITAAKAVRGSSATIERQVADAVVKLEEAKQVFIAAIIK
jgi:hypothetical protein